MVWELHGIKMGKKNWKDILKTIKKIDKEGNVIWRNYFGGSNNDRSYDAIETSEGGYILIGASESNDFDISKNSGSYDIWVVKLSKFGDLEWEKSYGGAEIDKGVSIVKNIENSYTILGNTNSQVIKGAPSKGMNDYIMIKLDSEGNTISKIRHGGSDFDFAKDNKSSITAYVSDLEWLLLPPTLPVITISFAPVISSFPSKTKNDPNPPIGLEVF